MHNKVSFAEANREQFAQVDASSITHLNGMKADGTPVKVPAGPFVHDSHFDSTGLVVVDGMLCQRFEE